MSASVYGNYGVVADGDETLAHQLILILHTLAQEKMLLTITLYTTQVKK